MGKGGLCPEHSRKGIQSTMTERQIRYQQYLASDHWKELRCEAINRWGDRCSNCSVPKVEVHHLRYGTLYDVTTDDLMPLCRRCHEAVHSSKRLLDLLESNETSHNKRTLVLGFLAGKDEAIAVPVKYQSRAEIAWELRQMELLKIRKDEERKANHKSSWNQVPPPCGSSYVTISKKMMNDFRTKRGGFSGETIRALGLGFPLSSKWHKKLIGTRISRDAYNAAMAGARRHT